MQTVTLHGLPDFFLEHDVTRAPVVDAEGTLIGVVSVTDQARYVTDGSHSTSTSTHAVYRDVLASDYAEKEVEALRITETTTATVRDIHDARGLRRQPAYLHLAGGQCDAAQ